MRVRITGLYGDVDRSTTITRYYFAERVGGNPTDMGWESQAVHLLPKNRLYELLNQPVDYPIAQALGAGESRRKKPNLPKEPPGRTNSSNNTA